MNRIENTDLKKAIKTLDEKNLTLCIVKENEIIFQSSEKGIYPIYKVFHDLKEKVNNSSVADRVIGKAAMMLYKELNIKHLYTNTISQKALDIDHKFKIDYKKKVPYIKNRDNTDSCPVEKLSTHVHDTKELIEKIEIFLKKVGKL